MHVLLVLVGLLAGLAGAVMIHSAMPIEDMAAAALFTSGTIALVGGLILCALAAAVRNLARIAERLEIQPLPPIASVGREDPAPRPVRPPPAAAGAARPSLLGWLGRGSAPVPMRAARTPPLRSTPAPDPTPPPVDLAPLTRIPEPPREAALPPSAPTVRPEPKPAVAPGGAAAATVYRSGVIDGMAYSLFMDGSIEAELPSGRVKFATIDELQKYLLGSR